MRKEITAIVKEAIKQQNVSYNRGHENQGASIDVLAEIYRLVGTRQLRGNKKAGELLTEIENFDNLNNEALKYAKQLSFPVRAYVKKEVLSLTR